MESSSLVLVLAFLLAAVTSVPFFKKLGLGSVMGYLVAGAILGPWGFKVVQDPAAVLHFSELGVVILLFLIGLELKPKRLWVMRKAVFGLGGLQVLLTSLILMGISFAFGEGFKSSFVLALGLSLSSTAFAIQLMTEKGIVNTHFGRKSFAILLFQDIIAIPLLAIVPLLALDHIELSPTTGFTILKIALVVAILIVVGIYLLNPLFRMVASSRTREIFTAAALFLILGVAGIMQSMGLSMALGSFIAGVLLSDSEYRHQLEADIEPFKGLLLGLFFMAVGMSIDFGLIIHQPMLVFIGVIALFVVKFFVVYCLGILFQLDRKGAFTMALLLSQGGEFAYVVYGLAAQTNVIDLEVSNLLIVIVTLSMPLTALAFIAFEKIMVLRAKNKVKNFDEISEDNPVIIAGFGRVGQIPARILRVMNIGFTALDHDPDQIDVIRRFGNKVYYGDASRLDLLEAAGARKAKILFLAIDHVENSVKAAEIIVEHFPNLKIIARARNRAHAHRLMDLGIKNVWRETLSSSLEMTEFLLEEMGFSEKAARKAIQVFKDSDEKLLVDQHKIRHDEKLLIDQSRQAQQQLADLLQQDLSKQVSELESGPRPEPNP